MQPATEYQTSAAEPDVNVENSWAFPLSFAQQRLWLLNQLEPANTSYNIPWSIRLTGRLHVEALENSLNEIVRRHEVLRTTFTSIDGEPVQIVAKSVRVRMPLIDLSARPAEEREQEAVRIAKATAQTPVNLEQGPLVQAQLIRLSDHEHVLLLTLHHIVFDGWSRRVFTRELAACYEAFRENKPVSLPELRLQYADYAVWQRKHLKGKTLEKQLTYWKKQLTGAPAALNLPTDRPRPAVQTHRGAAYPVSLPHAVSDRLALFAREHGASVFMVLLAGFQTLLARYTGDDDVLVGTPIANRTRAEAEDLIGLFANTLVLRGNLSGDPPFLELVQRTRQTALDAYAHQEVPFEKLVEELNPERTLSRNPLFQVVFSLQNGDRQAFELPGLDLALLEGIVETAKFDLSVFLSESPRGLRGRVEYNTDLFDRETIEQLWRHYERLLRAALDKPELRLSELPLLTAAEQENLLQWSRAASEYPCDASIPHLFDQQAAARPNAIALEFGAAQMSYGELQRRSNQMARHLLRRGVGPGVLVSLCVERSLEMIVALLGILKAGAAYVPLDPGHPQERLAFMLEDTRTALLLTQHHLLERLPKTLRTPVICLDRERKTIAQEQAIQPLPSGHAEDLAYVMYTSGSTGRPKGVAVPHRGVVRLVCNANYVSFSPEDVLLQFAPISFDASTFEIWGALLNGGKLVICPAHSLSLDELAGTIQRRRVTTLWLTAGLFHLMVEHHLESLRGVRQLLAGGDVLSVAHVRRAVEKLEGCRVINGYGPTENTTFTCCHTITLETIGGSVPIGRPISNTQAYVLDESRQIAPVGVAGELYAGGDGLAHGYLNSPELTAERFVQVEGLGRLYRTGDRCRWRKNGLIEFLGRTDNQVKLRGYRIELGEVEAALNRHSAVRRSLVMVREDKPGLRQLVAYIVRQPEARPQCEDVLQHVKKSLPEFMVPASIVVLDEFPLTANGKVDRGSLPRPELTPAERTQASGPRDELERALFDIWKQVLGIGSCAVTDNFFDLGGHSLLLLRLGALIEKEFKRVIPLSFLFESATIEKMAAFLRAGPTAEPEFFVPFQDKGVGPAFFCVHCVIGEVMMFRHLAQFLDSDQRFFGIQFPPQQRTPEFVPSIEAVATRYVDALLAFEPQGPYMLGGWSAGASVALEMAQLLQARGHAVELLVAIDAAPPNTGTPARRKTPFYYCQLIANLPRCIVDDLAVNFSWKRFFCRARRSLSSPIAKVLAARRGTADLVKYKVNRIIRAGDYSESAQLFIEAFYHALRRYVPKPYQGRVVLYKAKTQALFFLREPDRIWRTVATDLEVVSANGTHVSLIDELHVKPLAEDLNKRLRKCRDSHAKTSAGANVLIESQFAVACEDEKTKECVE